MTSALDNLHVVDFSRVLAGPFATMILGDLGATITKIERPGSGDDTRAWGPPYDDTGEATYFDSVNRNKRSLSADLTDDGDLARVLRLCADADVVVENFRPGVMDRLGLGYRALRAANPGLVYCSITGFGRSHGAGLAGYDLLIQALGGLMSITGEPEGEPQKAGVALVDVLAGLFASVGILAALQFRNVSHEGQRVEVDLLSSLLASLVNQGAAFTAAGVTPRRMGNAHPSIAPYDLLHTADGDLVLAVGNDAQFIRLCEVLGNAALGKDRRFAANAARVEHRVVLRQELEGRLAVRSAREWAKALSAVGVPAGVVNDVPTAFRFAAELGLEPTVRLTREDGTFLELTRNPIKLSLTPASYRLAPPRLSSDPALAGDPVDVGGDPTIQRALQ